MTQIIAFSGRKQSGKSTSGEYIYNIIKQNNIPLDVKLYSFADPLKQDICMNLLGLSYNQCYGTDEEKNTISNIEWIDMPIEIQQKHFMDILNHTHLTARQVMEVVGTEIFRKLYNNIWVDATINKIKNEKKDLAIILDNRFPNEVDAVLAANGKVIRLTRNLFNSNAEAEKALDKENYDWSKFSLIVDNHDMTIENKEKIIVDFLKKEGILLL